MIRFLVIVALVGALTSAAGCSLIVDFDEPVEIVEPGFGGAGGEAGSGGSAGSGGEGGVAGDGGTAGGGDAAP